VTQRLSSRVGRFDDAEWTIQPGTGLLEPFATAFCNISDCAAGRRARVVLDEASRVAQELHDGLAQNLFAIAATAKELGEREDLEPSTRRGLATLFELAQASSRQLREAFEPFQAAGAVARTGLAAAISDLGRAAGGLALEISVDEELADARDLTAELLYRTCREGIANAARHAGATRCRIRCTVAGADAIASVEDDGVGIRANAARRGVGLRFLAESVEQAGGCLELRASPRGTVLTAHVPRVS
jgi:two-component system NarL family sensor kinase